MKEAVPVSLLLVPSFEHACVSCTVDPDHQLLLASFQQICWGNFASLMHSVSTCAQWCVVRKLLEDAVGYRNPALAGCAGDFFAEDAWHVTGAGYSASSSLLSGQSIRTGIIFSPSRDVA